MANRSSRPPATCRVALVEDRQQVREHWASVLNSFEGFLCVRSCASGEEAMETIPPLRPDIVLMDIFLPGMSGIECTVRLKEASPSSRVLILTVSDDEELIFPALEAGADGYLLKHSTPQELHLALLDVMHGGVPMTSGVARRVIEFFHQRGRSRGHVEQLSQREAQVLDQLAKGYVNKEIAEKLSLSVETIRSYLKRVYEKMHVHSRAEAVAKYIASRESARNTLS